jgi:hypothetical protein
MDGWMDLMDIFSQSDTTSHWNLLVRRLQISEASMMNEWMDGLVYAFSQYDAVLVLENPIRNILYDDLDD